MKEETTFYQTWGQPRQFAGAGCQQDWHCGTVSAAPLSGTWPAPAPWTESTTSLRAAILLIYCWGISF